MNGFFGALRKILSAICVLLLCGQVLLVSYVAFSRYVLNSTPAWGEKTALLCMVWFCLLSATLAIKDDSHLRMTLIDNFVSAKAVQMMNHIDLLLVAVFGFFMFWEGIGLTQLTHRNIMTGLGIPSSILYAAIPVAGVAFVVAAIDKGRESVCQRKR